MTRGVAVVSLSRLVLGVGGLVTWTALDGVPEPTRRRNGDGAFAATGRRPCRKKPGEAA